MTLKQHVVTRKPLNAVPLINRWETYQEAVRSIEQKHLFFGFEPPTAEMVLAELLQELLLAASGYTALNFALLWTLAEDA